MTQETTYTAHDHSTIINATGVILYTPRDRKEIE
jgi:hypothetical protein